MKTGGEVNWKLLHAPLSVHSAAQCRIFRPLFGAVQPSKAQRQLSQWIDSQIWNRILRNWILECYALAKYVKNWVYRGYEVLIRMSILLTKYLSESISSTRVSEIQLGLYHDQVSLTNAHSTSNFNDHYSLNIVCNNVSWLCLTRIRISCTIHVICLLQSVNRDK